MKNKMAKRIGALVLAGIMSSAVLAGCGGSGSGSTSSAAPAADSQAAVPSAESTKAESTAAESTAEAGTQEVTAEFPEFITVFGSAAGGMGTLFPQAIWQVLNEYLPTTGSVQVTAGATQDMYLMEEGEGWFSYGTAVGARDAMQGINGYEEKPITKVKFEQVCNFNENVTTYLVRKGSGITSIDDLNNPNMKVDVGVAGSGAEKAVKNFCQLFGLLDDNGDYVFNAQYVSVSDATEMIQNNELDAIRWRSTGKSSAQSSCMSRTGRRKQPGITMRLLCCRTGERFWNIISAGDSSKKLKNIFPMRQGG